jgi:hypothetical protein
MEFQAAYSPAEGCLMPDGKALAEAKRRIQELENALLSFDQNPGTYDAGIRDRLVKELREALENYYAVVSGQLSKSASSDA